MLNFKIDQEKCIECGKCSKECPVLIIDGKNGIPVIKEGKEKNCIQCQHCLAICPTGALSIFGKDPKNSIPVSDNIPSPDQIGQLIKTRRTIRKYKDELLDEALLNDLLETAAYAPTGHNKNQVLISITDNFASRDKVRNLVYNTIKKAVEDETLPKSMAMFANFQRVWEAKGIDVLFRNAPHIMFTSAPEEITSSVADCVISMSYFELYANTQGIGTLWDGLVRNIIEFVAPEIKAELGIPEDHLLGYVMIFGKPTTKYSRSVQSEGLNLNRI